MLGAIERTEMPEPSLAILATMVLLIAAASGVFWMLTRRWVRGRRMGALYEWARANGMRLVRDGSVELPEALTQLAECPTPLLALGREGLIIAQVRTMPSHAQLQAQRWNVLLRKLPSRWPTTALRPALSPQSLIDLYALPAIPGLLSPERFLVHGVDRRAAAAVVASPLRALLPADVGLVLVGNWMILEFSTRPFDGTEFSRLIAVTDQLVEKLPAPAEPA